MGHRGGARLPQHPQPVEDGPADGDRHLLLHHDPPQDPLLHGQPDPADGAHLLPLHPGLLPARRGRRESDPRHLDPALARRLPAARLEDLAADLARASAHRQVPALHFPHEHGLHPRHRDHPQLELPRAPDPQDAQLDPGGLPQVPTRSAAHEEAQENPAPVDDGDARTGRDASPPPYPPDGIARRQDGCDVSVVRHVPRGHERCSVSHGLRGDARHPPSQLHGRGCAATARCRWRA